MNRKEQKYWMDVYREFEGIADECQAVSGLLEKVGTELVWGNGMDGVCEVYGVEFRGAVFSVTQDEFGLEVDSTFEIQNDVERRPVSVCIYDIEEGDERR